MSHFLGGRVGDLWEGLVKEPQCHQRARNCPQFPFVGECVRSLAHHDEEIVGKIFQVGTAVH